MQNTEAHVVEGGTSDNVVTAHARENPMDDVGYSFIHCSVTGTGGKSYLGRTWRPYPVVVFAYSDITDVIHPAGWSYSSKTGFEKYVHQRIHIIHNHAHVYTHHKSYQHQYDDLNTN